MARMSAPRRLLRFSRYARELAALGFSFRDRVRIAGVACWLLARQYVPRLPAVPVLIRVRRNGAPVSLTLRTYDDLDVVHELFVRDEYGAVVLPPDAKVVLDIGANIGLASLDLRTRFPHARIIACDPDPGVYDTLVANVSHDPGIEVHQVALSDHDGELTFWTSSTAVVSSVHRTLDAQRAVQVPALTLTSFLERVGVDQVDLLKLDVEGAETQVLDDPEPLARVGALIGEIHPALIGQSAEAFAAEYLADYDVTLSVRPGLAESSERLFWAVRRG